MLLADLGLTSQAKAYLENILGWAPLDGDESSFEGNIISRLTLPEMCESPEAFRAALTSFEQRLLQNVPELETEGKLSTKDTAVNAPPPMLVSEQPAVPDAPTIDPDATFMTAASVLPPDSSVSDPTSLPSGQVKDKVTSKAAPSKIVRKRNTQEMPEMNTPFAKGAATMMGDSGALKPPAPMSGPPTTQTGGAPPSDKKTPAAEKPKAEPEGSKKAPAPSKKPEPAPKSAPAVMASKCFLKMSHDSSLCFLYL